MSQSSAEVRTSVSSNGVVKDPDVGDNAAAAKAAAAKESLARRKAKQAMRAMHGNRDPRPRRDSYKVYNATFEDFAKHRQGANNVPTSRGGSTSSSRQHSSHSYSKPTGGNGPARNESDGMRQHRAASMKLNDNNKPSVTSTQSNGTYDYEDDEYGADPFDLEEPFDSDDETAAADGSARPKRIQRPRLNLPMPRTRIRTLSGTVPPVGYAPVWGGPTMCLRCLEFFDLPKDTAKYVEHLLDKHQLVVSGIEHIVDLKRYIEHWRHRLSKGEKLEDLCPKVVPKEGDKLHGKCDFYYLMSEKNHEDRKVRERLALRRLEEVLSCQQRERNDALFMQQCLFCRYIARGNRSKLIHHLYMIHHLNLGSPDNLVFVAEYLDMLRDKINKFQCIYCEKSYADHATLMEHMRKRQHREVNPNNNYYDKFYIINYLELGKKWLEVLAEDIEDNTVTFQDSDDEEDEDVIDGWHEWQEDNCDEEENMAVCLICDEAREDIGELLQHMQDEHKYDLLAFMKKQKMNFYERVKFINYARKMSHQCHCFVCGLDDLHSWPALRKHLQHDDHLQLTPKRDYWDKDEHLSPQFENDHLLWMLESYLEQQHIGDFDQEGDEVSAETEHRLRLMSMSEKDAAEGGELPIKTSTNRPVVIPEDLPDLTNSELKKNPELLEQLK